MPLDMSAFSKYKLTPEQQSRLAGMLQLAPQIQTTRTAIDAPWTGRQEYEDGISATAAGYDKSNRSKASHNRLVTIGKVVSAIPLAFAAAPAFAGAGASASVPGAVSATAAPVGGGTVSSGGATSSLLSRIGSFFGSKGAEMAVNTGLSLYGQRQQNKVNDQARTDTLANQAKLIELEQTRLANELQNTNLDREEARRLNDAIQALEAKKFALQQEDANFQRGEYEKEQTRLEPYRKISASAQQRLAAMLGLR